MTYQQKSWLSSDKVLPEDVNKWEQGIADSLKNDGSVVLTAEQKGIDAVSLTALTTLQQVSGLINVAMPTGTVLAISTTSIPQGFLPMNGSAISRTTYANLFSIIGTTYGVGDGTTTFNLPNLSDNRYIKGSSTVGNPEDAGLPNITAMARVAGGNDWGVNAIGATSGAFSTIANTGSVGISWYTSGGGYGSTLNFNANQSNNIYGKSDTVQPKSLSLVYIIKY